MQDCRKLLCYLASIPLGVAISPTIQAQVVGGEWKTVLQIDAGFSIDGIGASPESLVSMGDINGDGFADIAVGIRAVFSPRGKVHFVSGLDGSEILPFLEPGGTKFGVSLDAEDFNQDGILDLLVGDPGAKKVFIFSGLDRSQLYEVSDTQNSSFGSSVSVVGDQNTDQVPDFVVGAPEFWPGGSVFVYSGSDGTLLYQIDAPGLSTTANFGASVSGLKDVDGDGVDEILIGAPGSSNGEVYVYSGSNQQPLHSPVVGGVLNQEFGAMVAECGDIDGDQAGDFIVGAYKSGLNRMNSVGAAYIYSGGRGNLLLRKLDGEDEVNHFGWTVAAAGDLN
ncbi:MAG: hypothetical protein DWQ01_10070 [Planctomycetota bacterium]|nr:MAG: hypothetical protein DWQ01_10070 [Planctomycetota bacterium]